MPDTLLSLITRYAVRRTKHTEESMLDWFDEHPDYCINYILRTALPVEFCFDGLKHTFSRVEDNDSVRLMCTFWYLTEKGESLSAALRFNAEVKEGQIRYRYSIIPATGFPAFADMQSKQEKILEHIISNHCWPKWARGEIKP